MSKWQMKNDPVVLKAGFESVWLLALNQQSNLHWAFNHYALYFYF